MDVSKLTNALQVSKNIMEKTENMKRGNLNFNQQPANYPTQQPLAENYNGGGGLFDEIASVPNNNYTQNQYENSYEAPYEVPPIPKKKGPIKNALLREIAENPIGNDVDEMGNGSILDKIDLGNFPALSNAARHMPSQNSSIPLREGTTVPKYTPLREEATAPQSRLPYGSTNYSMPVQQQSSIDYSLLKLIIEEAVKKSTAALSKKLITEAKDNQDKNNNLSVMNIGKEFSFITKNGDLYKAKLTFIKNINK